jgi:hypothetical protein
MPRTRSRVEFSAMTDAALYDRALVIVDRCRHSNSFGIQDRERQLDLLRDLIQELRDRGHQLRLI